MKYIKLNSNLNNYNNLIKHFNNNFTNIYLYKNIQLRNNIFKIFNFNLDKELIYYHQYYIYKYINDFYYSDYFFKKNIYSNFLDNKYKINKYIPFDFNNFYSNYELFYKLNIKNIGKNIIEISSNPNFFEIFNYFQNIFSLYLNSNYSVFFFFFNEKKKIKLINL